MRKRKQVLIAEWQDSQQNYFCRPASERKRIVFISDDWNDIGEYALDHGYRKVIINI